MQPTCSICVRNATCFANYQVEQMVKKLMRSNTGGPIRSASPSQMRDAQERLKRPLAKLCRFYEDGRTQPE